MIPSSKLTSEQLKEIIEDENKTENSAREVPEQVEDGEEVLDPDISISVLNTVLNTINNKFEHHSLGAAVRLLNALPIRQSTEDHVPGQEYSIPGLPGTKFLAHQVSATWCTVRMWVGDAYMPGALVADEVGLGKTFTSVSAAMICTLLTEKVVMGLPVAILCGDTLDEWVNMAQNDFPGIINEERERYPSRRQHSVPRRLNEIQTTPLQGHPALTSALEPILVVTMPGVAEMFRSVINEMTYRTDFKLMNSLHAENANHTHGDPNTSIDKPENRWNIPLVPYHTFTSRAKPSSNGQLAYCAWSFGIFDKSHRYKTKNSVGCKIAMKARIGFTLQVTAAPEFHSLSDWCYRMMWLFSGAPEDPADDTLKEKDCAEGLYSAVKSSMHGIRTEDKVAQEDAARRMI